MNLVAANVNWRTGRALATSAASQRAATVAGAWAGGTGFENLTRTPKLNFCIGEVRPSRSQPGRVGGRLENVPWLEGSQLLRPGTGALRRVSYAPATTGNFGVRAKGIRRVELPQKIRPAFEAGLMQLTCEKLERVERYAARFLRRIRSVLAPNGSSSNAPAIIVVGSGTITN